MKKPIKIKRYKNIYSSNSPFSSPLSIVISISILFGLGLIGWFSYTPIYNAVISLGVEKVPSVSVTEPIKPSEVTTTPDTSTSTPDSNAVTDNTSTPPTVTPPVVSTGIKAVYAPHNVLCDTSKLDEFLKGLKGSGVNTVMVQAKNGDGNILYRTQLEVASAAQSENAFDPKTVAGKIKDAGYTPVVMIEAFKDPLYARAERTAAVTYMDSDFTWLDNSPDLGGRPWLNPYADSAQDYIIAIGSELASCGFSEIMLNSVQFPSGVGQDKARYGGDRLPSIMPLNSFVTKAEKQFAEKGAKTSVVVPGMMILQDNAILYGGNPLNITASNLVVEMIGSNFPANTTISGEVIENPSQNYEKLVSALSSYASNTASGKNLVAIIGGATREQTLLSQIQLEAQIKALNSKFDGFIVYNQSGKYTVSGIK